jgi:hypothetical protein
MAVEQMVRVTRSRPCPICGHSDWCLVSPDASTAICPRTKEGSLKRCGDAGYLHILEDRHNGHDRHEHGAKWRHTLTVAQGQDGPTPDFGQLSARYESQLASERLRDRTPDVGELLSILLAGYKRGGQATRMERAGDNFTPMSFDVYGPKAIAGISNLPSALASRCIPILMFRAARDSLVPKRRIDPTAPLWAELRDDLHCMALAHGASLPGMACWQPDCAGLNGRDLELWLPILAMAKLVEDTGLDGLVETVERHAIKSIESAHEEIVAEVDEILLRLLREMLQDKSWGVTANEVLQAAIGEEPSLFPRYTARGVAAVFNRYGIKSRHSGGKRYFSATENQWKAIGQSYGIDLTLRGHLRLSPHVLI